MSRTADDFAARLAALAGKKPAAPSVTLTAVAEPPHAPSATTEETAATSDARPVGAGEHVVKPGDCISSIALSAGHFWQTIWDDPANAELKAARGQPNVLLEGDRVHVPALRPKQEPGDTEKRHRFVRRGEPSHFAVRVLDQDVPRANEPFTLVIDEKQTITGHTDPEGKLDVPIPGSARLAVLTVGTPPDTLKLKFNLGGLETVGSYKGLQTRLRNLGYACEVTESLDEQTLAALNDFRAAEGMPQSDSVDDTTRARLLERHGS